MQFEYFKSHSNLSSKSATNPVVPFRSFAGMQIFVRTFKQIFPLDVCDSDIIYDVKRNICAFIGVLPATQNITFQGDVLDDSIKLVDYGIEDGNGITLHLPGICIHVVALAGETFTLEVAEDQGISYVKLILEEAYGFPYVQQKLSFNGGLLDNGHKLTDYNIVNESTLNLVISLMCDCNECRDMLCRRGWRE